MAISFNSVLIIAAVAVLVPVVLGFLPVLPVPGAVLEVIAGIVIGPSVLGWVHVDAPVAVLSDLGLGMLLFLAGLEIDADRLRGELGRLAALAFACSALLGVGCGYALSAVGSTSQPLFLAIVLMSTSTGLLLPLLKDAGLAETRFGQLVMTAGALAEVATIMLLSLLFSATSKTSEERLASLVIFLGLLAVFGLALGRVRRLAGLERLLDRLEDRSAQLRVRATLTLALAFGVLAYRFGFASILGAFAAGLVVRMIDITGQAPHPQFETKLQGIGFGFLIPIFFITTGVQFDLKALAGQCHGDRRSTAVPHRSARGTRASRAAVYPLRRLPPRHRRWPDAGDHAHLRDRGDPDRAGGPADLLDHQRLAAYCRAALSSRVPGRGPAAAGSGGSGSHAGRAGRGRLTQAGCCYCPVSPTALCRRRPAPTRPQRSPGPGP